MHFIASLQMNHSRAYDGSDRLIINITSHRTSHVAHTHTHKRMYAKRRNVKSHPSLYISFCFNLIIEKFCKNMQNEWWWLQECLHFYVYALYLNFWCGMLLVLLCLSHRNDRKCIIFYVMKVWWRCDCTHSFYHRQQQYFNKRQQQ